ncbi:kinase-like protein [Cadophora sp. DSE1049]|nr:kinase-like protein [Cadophora sp. DSE1049]
MYNMNPFPSNAIDVTLGRKSLCPDIVSIPDDLADQNKIELVSSEDHSAIFIDSTMIESAPETNKRSWEWGAITESYRAANSPDTDPILRSIRRQNILKQGSVDPEETSRPAGSSRSYEPPKADLIADSIASADDLESLSRWNIPKSTSRGRRRGSPASTTSGASTGSPVLRYRRDEGGTERSSDPTEADPETLTFKHSSEAEPVSSDDRREPNKSSAYYSANSEAHGKELLRLKRPGMDSDALVVEYYSHSSGPGIESTPFVDGEYFRMLQQDEETSDTQPVQESGTSYSGIQKEAFSPNYFKTFFVEEKELGRGGMGVVLLVRHVLDGVNLGFFACKRILIGDDNAWLEKILVEVQLLSKLSHPNLVAYRHIWLEEFQIGRFAPSVPCVFILQQYCNAGDLKTYVLPSPKVPSTKEQLKEETRSRNSLQAETETKTEASFPLQRKLAFEEIYTIFKDIASGLAYLHGNGYIHRDLKPSNILLHQQDNEFRALISDFGEVRVDYQNSEAPYDYGMRPWDIYIAPELIKQDKDGQYGRYSTKSDVFCLGLILHFMCFGGLPFEGPGLKLGKEDTDPEMLREALVTWPGFQVTSNHRRERPDLPQQLHSLMSRLLALRPSDRPSAEEIEKTLRSEQNV